MLTIVLLRAGGEKARTNMAYSVFDSRGGFTNMSLLFNTLLCIPPTMKIIGEESSNISAAMYGAPGGIGSFEVVVLVEETRNVLFGYSMSGSINLII